MGRNHIMLYSLLIISLLVFIIGCTQKLSVTTTECDSITNPNAKLAYCAKINLNEGECNLRSESDIKHACLANFALNNNDSSFCDKMTDVSFINPCYQQIATATSNAVLCAKIENKPNMERDVCYGNIAANTKNISLCNNIESSDMKTLCIAAIKKDVSLCKSITDVNLKSLCAEVDKQ